MFILQIKKLRLTYDKQMMKFTQPASGNARMRFRLWNSKLITVPPTVRLYWTLGIQAGIGLLLGSLENCLPLLQPLKSQVTSRNPGTPVPPDRGQGCAMVVNEKTVKLSRSPEPNCYSPQAPEKG